MPISYKIGLIFMPNVNFDDERLRGIKVDDLHLIGDVHATMFPEATRSSCLGYGAIGHVQKRDKRDSFGERRN